MALTGKLSIEIPVHSPASKFFDLATKKLHHVQNVCERVHATKLHEGHDWHSVGGSVKHWTYVIDGKVTTCKETIESIDEQNKTVVYKFFDGDIDQHYKTLKLIFQVIENNNGGTSTKWTVEYEKVNEDVEAPYGYMEYFDKCAKELDAHLLQA
ncbi:MLP-like protein 43 [Arachis stenosperma]|uniref:MLP-like protein 43 n=1 Tax=Arachis stenosperma TaxID=217475 RepID=UPI0025AC179A|nr:MLP-like protein 43 [Arachis stenosperma]